MACKILSAWDLGVKILISKNLRAFLRGARARFRLDDDLLFEIFVQGQMSHSAVDLLAVPAFVSNIAVVLGRSASPSRGRTKASVPRWALRCEGETPSRQAAGRRRYDHCDLCSGWV